MHSKTRVKAQATKRSNKFGAANAANRVIKVSKVGMDNVRNKVGMKALEGFFDNLAAAKINEKSVLNQLVSNNSKLAATNEDLVAMVKKWFNEIKNLEIENSCPKKTGGIGASQVRRDPTLCPHCKKEGYHAPDAYFELAKKKDKRPPGWKIWL